jgi:hypothetical protein
LKISTTKVYSNRHDHYKVMIINNLLPSPEAQRKNRIVRAARLE